MKKVVFGFLWPDLGNPSDSMPDHLRPILPTYINFNHSMHCMQVITFIIKLKYGMKSRMHYQTSMVPWKVEIGKLFHPILYRAWNYLKLICISKWDPLSYDVITSSRPEPSPWTSNINTLVVVAANTEEVMWIHLHQSVNLHWAESTFCKYS